MYSPIPMKLDFDEVFEMLHAHEMELAGGKKMKGLALSLVEKEGIQIENTDPVSMFVVVLIEHFEE